MYGFFAKQKIDVSTMYITIASSHTSHFVSWKLKIIVDKCKINRIL